MSDTKILSLESSVRQTAEDIDYLQLTLKRLRREISEVETELVGAKEKALRVSELLRLAKLAQGSE
jgi:hypothetical protein